MSRDVLKIYRVIAKYSAEKRIEYLQRLHMLGLPPVVLASLVTLVLFAGYPRRK